MLEGKSESQGSDGGRLVQVYQLHLIQRTYHRHRFPGPGIHAVQNWSGPGACTGKGRRHQPDYGVYLYACTDSGGAEMVAKIPAPQLFTRLQGVWTGCLLSLFIVLFVLPGLLYLLDGVIQHTTLNLHFYKVSKEEK